MSAQNELELLAGTRAAELRAALDEAEEAVRLARLTLRSAVNLWAVSADLAGDDAEATAWRDLQRAESDYEAALGRREWARYRLDATLREVEAGHVNARGASGRDVPRRALAEVAGVAARRARAGLCVACGQRRGE